MKFFFYFILIVAAQLNAQVFESGFGSSAILSVKRGGNDINNDGIFDYSDLKLIGKKVYDQTSGLYAPYYSVENDKELFFPKSVETSDLNGDGVDEIITFSITGEENNSVLRIKAFKGDDGENLFSNEIAITRFNSNTPFYSFAADFTGDGKGEPGVVFFRENTSSENSEHFPVFILFNEMGETIIEYPLESCGITEGTNLALPVLGDFNGDEHDDFFLLVSEENDTADGIYRHKILLFDGASLSFSEVSPTFFRNNNTTIPISTIGEFSGQNRDEVIFICSETPKSLQTPDYKLLLVDLLTSEEKTFTLSQFLPSTNFAYPEIIVSARLSNGYHSVILALRTGEDFDNDTLPDQYTLVAINTITGSSSFIKTNNLSSNGYVTEIIAADFNNDNLDEILTVNKAYGDTDGDSIPDGSEITLYDNSGNALYSSNNLNIGLADITLDDGIYDITTGNLDSDNFLDVAMVFRHGDDYNHDGIRDGSLLCYFEPATSSLIESQVSTAVNGASKQIDKIVTVNNDITHQELLRMIDLSSPELSPVQGYFVNREYDNALRLYLKYYYEVRQEPSDLVKKEYYLNNGKDEFVTRLKKFSTSATLEQPGFQWFSNLYNDAGAAAIRLGRISATFGARCYDSNGIDQDPFYFGLKSLVSHLRYLDRPENHTEANNHALLFEIKEYALATPYLTDFKQFRIDAPFSFQQTMFNRIDDQLIHILPDGLHDEHSITYSFLIGNTLNIFTKFFSNNPFYQYSDEFIVNLVTKSQRMFTYFTHMVKPISISTVDTVMIKRPDIPVYGDSESKIVNRWYGKQSTAGNYSILNEPFIQDHVDFWDNDSLIENMRFVLNNSIQNSGVPPSQTSMAFPYGGFFISRSNWIDPSSDNLFDHNARYMHFKAGEVVPTPGPYEGYATNSRHGHADLLSVDLTAYNKNIVVDPGGYVNSTMTGLINSFDPQYFINLYNFHPPANNFDMVRSYFKSTAAHSTVNIGRGQLKYKSNWRWWDLETLKSQPIKYRITEDFDLVMGEYSKTDQNGTLAHNRTVVYNKSKSNDRIFSDYWVFIDRIDMSDYSGNPDVGQNWHISPEQVQQTLSPTGTFTGDTFIMQPLYFTESNNISAELVPSYTMTHNELVESNVLKYNAFSDDNNFYIATVIIPFPEGEPVENLVTEPIKISSPKGGEISPDRVSAFKISFTTATWEKIEDYLIISFDNECYNWKPEFAGQKTTSANTLEFYRYVDGKPFQTKSILSLGENRERPEETPKTFKLDSVYPNPFNPETNIKFTIAESADVLLEVYTILGEKVFTLIDENLPEGNYTVNFNGMNLSSGVYLLKLRTEKNIATQKMVLLK